MEVPRTMQLAKVKMLCDQLHEVIAAGPGKNDLALQEAMGIVSMLQQAAPWIGPPSGSVTDSGASTEMKARSAGKASSTIFASLKPTGKERPLRHNPWEFTTCAEWRRLQARSEGSVVD